MKSWRLFIGFMAIVLYSGCSGEIIEPESVDADYGITYYAQPPHNNESLGYLIAKGGGSTDFIKLSAMNSSPYTLMVIVADNKGQEALDFVQQKEDSPIKSVREVEAGLSGTAKAYSVVTTKYFQSRYFYVSESYSVGQSYDINVMPSITVKMNAGQDVSTVEEEYKGVLKLLKENDDGTFLFNCSFKTSYEVLMVTMHIFDKLEVAWAEPIMLGKYTYTNK